MVGKPQTRRRVPKSRAGDLLRDRFANNLRRLRVQKGLTQEQLASAAGISRCFVNQLERGHFSANLETIASLAAALERSPEALLVIFRD